MNFLGYDFRDEKLLEEALTTPSYRMQYPSAADNQRLEFLGDAVLGLLAARRLYGEFPAESEGALTVRRTRMVSAAALCDAAGRLNLAAKLRRNRGAEPLPAGSKTLADAIEAILGAAYLDGGLEAAATVFAGLGLSAAEADGGPCGNPKGELQIRAQAMRPPRRPVYALLSAKGKAHAPLFTVRVSVEGVGEAVAEASTHKAAEARAAALLLERMTAPKGR